MSDTPADQFDHLRARADALIDAMRYQDALEFALRAVGLRPEDASGHIVVGRSLLSLERPAEASTVASRAIALDPKSAVAHQLRSTALARQARKSHGPTRIRLARESIKSASEAVRLNPTSAVSHMVLAEAAAVARKLKIADSEIRRAIELAPTSSYTWALASYVALRARNWSAAESAARRAIAIDPKNGTAINNLGSALRAMGRWREGTQLFVDAAQINPRSTIYRRNVSSSGLMFIRLVIVLLLLPVLLLKGGVVIFLLLGVGSNLYFKYKPQHLLAIERWTAPVALRMASSKHRRPISSTDDPLAVKGDWSALRRTYRLGTPVVVLVGSIPLVVFVAALTAMFRVPKPEILPPAITTIISFMAVCVLLRVLFRRQRRKLS